MQRDWVCVGDSFGKLHLLDLKNDFKLVKSYSTEHRDMIDVHMTNGCLITAGSADNTVRISSLTDPPQPIVTIEKHSRSRDTIHRVSITLIDRKKNDFDEVPENLVKSRSKKNYVIYHKNKKKTILLKYLKIKLNTNLKKLYRKSSK